MQIHTYADHAGTCSRWLGRWCLVHGQRWEICCSCGFSEAPKKYVIWSKQLQDWISTLPWLSTVYQVCVCYLPSLFLQCVFPNIMMRISKLKFCDHARQRRGRAGRGGGVDPQRGRLGQRWLDWSKDDEINIFCRSHRVRVFRKPLLAQRLPWRRERRRGPYDKGMMQYFTVEPATL